MWLLEWLFILSFVSGKCKHSQHPHLPGIVVTTGYGLMSRQRKVFAKPDVIFSFTFS